MTSPDELNPIVERKIGNIGDFISTSLESENFLRELSALDEFPVDFYRFERTALSQPADWVLNDLKALSGPDEPMSFPELWSESVTPLPGQDLESVYQRIAEGHSIDWRVRFRWAGSQTSVLHVGSYDSQSGSLKGALVRVSGTNSRAKDLELEKIRSMGMMAVGVAHDLNNLICAMLSFARFAQDEISENSRGWNDLNEVIKAGERAASLTGQLLTFSRVRVHQESVDLNHRLSELSTMIARLVSDRIQLRLKTSPQPAMVSIAPIQFDQVVLNLALNARDAMLPKGGTLSILLEPGNTDGEVLLKIRDTGKGMDRDTLRKTFDPFFTTKQEGAGSGLGLATCFSIVENSGGQINVESSPGQGTLFTVCWPIDTAVAEDDTSRNQDPTSAAS